MRRTGLAVGILLLVVAMLGLVGCQQIAEQAAETAIEKSTGTKIDKNGDSITIEGEGGEKASIGTGELPQGFPADVPVYEGAAVTGSFAQGSGAEQTYSVTLETSDDPATVNAWYLTELEAKGWTIDTQANNAENYVVTATNATQQVSVGVVQGGDTGTTISLTVTPKS